jgi:hypothetical protein
MTSSGLTGLDTRLCTRLCRQNTITISQVLIVRKAIASGLLDLTRNTAAYATLAT